MYFLGELPTFSIVGDEAWNAELAIRILALYVTFEFEDEARSAEIAIRILPCATFSIAGFEAHSAELLSIW